MDFGFYLPCYWPDMSFPAEQMYSDMIEEAKSAERLGYSSLTIPEHHFINYLVHPNPLLTAVKVATATKHIPIVTAILVLPFYDVRRLAGEIAQADCLMGGRLQIGVGRGAFRYEFDRLGIPVEESRERFDESLELLIKLLSEVEVSWRGKYYNFPSLTITPRPVQKPHPPIWIAAVTGPAIASSVKRGFNVMTTPLRDPLSAVFMQSEAFFGARPLDGKQRFSMLRIGFVSESRNEVEEKLGMALENHRLFVNVYTTPGQVEQGGIVPIEVAETIDDIRENLLIGMPEEVIEKLRTYERVGIHEIQMNMNFGPSHQDVLASQQLLATKVMPAFQLARQVA
jgi:alkanesulfonate monooxygenase SsuD/methylene tetrahydromethanopterin reductase-like flavin-dependent oxidoreductase (luciferase family)